jgi:hypothetical protein
LSGILNGSIINSVPLLQFNATIIVGVLLFLTLSEGYFNNKSSVPVSQNSTNQSSVGDNILLTRPPPLQISLTLGILLPFSISAIIILIAHFNELRSGVYSRDLYLWALLNTVSGIIYLIGVLIFLLISLT